MEIKRQIKELSPNNKIILREIVLENARNGRVFGHLELELLIICLLETEDGQKRWGSNSPLYPCKSDSQRA